MTSSPPRGSRVAALPRQLSVAALSVLGLLACGGDDVSAGGPIGPSGAVELEFSGFLNDRGQVFAVDASEVTLSCDGSISVLFESAADGTLANWLLRPPGACESFDQCGYISLAALREGGNRVTTAGAATTLLMRLTPGVYSFEAKLLDGDGEEFLQDAEPVADTLQAVTLVAQDSCSSTTSASGGSGAGGASTSTGGSGGGGTTGSSGGAGGAAGALGLAGAAGADQLAGAGGQEG